jgi:hypothetical protein
MDNLKIEPDWIKGEKKDESNGLSINNRSGPGRYHPAGH